MLTFAYKVGGWVGVAKCLHNHKNHQKKRTNRPRRKAAGFCDMFKKWNSWKKYTWKQTKISYRNMVWFKNKFLRQLRITVKKIFMGWVGFRKSYVIYRLGHGKCLRPITRWVGGVKKGQKHAYVIFEWSQRIKCM